MWSCRGHARHEQRAKGIRRYPGFLSVVRYALQRGGSRPPRLAPCRARGVRLDHRAVGLRQVHLAQCRCGVPQADRRHDYGRWRSDRRTERRPRHGVSAILAVSMEDGTRERRVRPQDERQEQASARNRRTHAARPSGPACVRESLSGPSLRRYEAARRHRAGARHRPQDAPARRAVRLARCTDPRHHAAPICGSA